jgi:hypothetical protein
MRAGESKWWMSPPSRPPAARRWRGGPSFCNRPPSRPSSKTEVAKGNVFACARVAGILAAKKTGEFIPLCHPLKHHSLLGRI